MATNPNLVEFIKELATKAAKEITDKFEAEQKQLKERHIVLRSNEEFGCPHSLIEKYFKIDGAQFVVDMFRFVTEAENLKDKLLRRTQPTGALSPVLEICDSIYDVITQQTRDGKKEDAIPMEDQILILTIIVETVGMRIVDTYIKEIRLAQEKAAAEENDEERHEKAHAVGEQTID